MKKNYGDNKKVVLVIYYFGLLGLFLLLNFALRKRIFYKHHYYLNILLIPFFSISGLLIFAINHKTSILRKHFMGFCIFLILLDQFTKIFLMYFGKIKYPIFLISNWLYIEPQFNPWGSYLGDLLQTKIPLLGIFELLSLPLLYVIYKYCNEKINVNKIWFQSWFLFCFSGQLCSTIDTLVFGTSYDFITLNGMLKFDIKDYYLEIAKGCLIVTGIDWLAQKKVVYKSIKIYKLIKKWNKKDY